MTTKTMAKALRISNPNMRLGSEMNNFFLIDTEIIVYFNTIASQDKQRPINSKQKPMFPSSLVLFSKVDSDDFHLQNRELTYSHQDLLAELPAKANFDPWDLDQI